MSEVKKLIITRKKTDPKGNEYALMKISSAKAKRPEIRVIKFRKTPIKSKSKLDNNEENLSATKIYPSKIKKKNDVLNKEALKKKLRTKITDSPLTKSTKLNSFVSIFNTASKGKNSFIYKSPNQYPFPKNPNFKFPNNPKANNNLPNFNYNQNKSTIRNNLGNYKTENNFYKEPYFKEFMNNKENLRNKILVLAKKNKEYYSKLNNLKLKESKLNMIKIKKNKEKEKIKTAKNKRLYETQFKKQIINEIKEINKDKKKAVNELNIKVKKLKNDDIKNEKKKMKKMIKIQKKENYHKKRYNYFKIRSEEQKLRNRDQRSINLSGHKNMDRYSSFAKTMIDDEFKEIDQLQKKYEKLKWLNKEYNNYFKEIKAYENKRTNTPIDLDINRFIRKYYSKSLIEPSYNNHINKEYSTERISNKNFYNYTIVSSYKNSSFIII
jgi:hypothetical protein